MPIIHRASGFTMISAAQALFKVTKSALIAPMLFIGATSTSHAGEGSPTTDDSQLPATSHSSVSSAQKAALGSLIFNDSNLSRPKGQSCATCHNPANAFADPGKITSPGANNSLTGSRNTPSLTYLKFAGEFRKADWGTEWQGGLFWDGRADSFEEQALGPLFNPLEMNTTPAQLASDLKAASYQALIRTLYGAQLSREDGWQLAALDALAHFQQSDVFAPFTSKFDYSKAGIIELTEQEKLGKLIYDSKAMCIDCHAGHYAGHSLFTQFKHHNILTPRNPQLGFYSLPAAHNPQGKGFIDEGTGLNEKLPAEDKIKFRGQFRTPTLRNIALTAPYMHNGVFNTLEEVVNFYADIKAHGPAEVAENRSQMLGLQFTLTDEEQQALLAFLHTLTDGYPATAEQKQQLRAENDKKAQAYAEQKQKGH